MVLNYENEITVVTLKLIGLTEMTNKTKQNRQSKDKNRYLFSRTVYMHGFAIMNYSH